MQFRTIDELNKFRPKCLCGKSLTVGFSQPRGMKDDFTYTSAAMKIVSNDNWATLNALIYIDAKKAPHGEAEALLQTYVSSGVCSIVDAKFLSNAFPDSKMSANKFIKAHFTQDVQREIRMTMVKNCSDRNCKHRYRMETDSLTFDLASGKMNPFKIGFEYLVVGNDAEYSIHSREGKVAIRNNNANYSAPPLEISADKFHRLPFEADQLLNKIKLLLLFS